MEKQRITSLSKSINRWIWKVFNFYKLFVFNTLTVVDKINEISDACVLQSSKINEAAIGIEQVSAVVQSNSATAEESAAVSESMNKQANGLQNIVNKFSW